MSPEDVAVDPNERNLPDESGQTSESAQLHAAQNTPAQARAGQAAADVSIHAETALAEAPAYDSWIGRVLDERYRVTEHLGAGGMGDVFVAEHLKLRKMVAIKVIRAELAGNGEVAARFAREAMATAQFEHPHVASAIDYGTLNEGGAYFVMQLVRGESLRVILDRRGPLPWPEACELLAQVADALAAARGAGIVHRDLKPENILVETRDDGSYLAKILDFGIAHVAQPAQAAEDAKNRALTRVGTVMGTPGYMAPEQAVGERVDHRTDLYALGVVLWECLTGKTLWDGPDVMSIITRQLREAVPPPREVLSDPLFPRALDQLVLRLCARLPEQRPEHASIVRDELRSLARLRVTPATAVVERASAVVERANVTLVAARQTLMVARDRFMLLPPRSRALCIAASLSVLLALTTVLLRRGASPAPAPSDAAASLQAAAPKAEPAPTLAGRAIELAQHIVKAVPTPEPKTSIPKELEPDVQTMLEHKRSSERRRAATKILRYKGTDPLPPYVLSIARLERGRSCRDRAEAITEIEELRDARCLPALRRIADAPKNGCGFLGLSDCYACVRGPARDAVAHLAELEQ